MYLYSIPDSCLKRWWPEDTSGRISLTVRRSDSCMLSSHLPTVLSVHLATRSGLQHECRCCSVTGCDVTAAQWSWGPLDRPVSVAKTMIFIALVLPRKRWKTSCADCLPKSGRIATELRTTTIVVTVHQKPRGLPNLMRQTSVRPANRASAVSRMRQMQR